ncbi:transcription factor IIA, alpha/beta subunit-domain-containing protein [Haematococcus lacustris]
MSTTAVYRWVIDDVIAKVKPEVVQEGLDETVLDDLRTLWEAKLVQKGLLGNDTIPAAPPAISFAQGMLMRPQMHGFPAGLAMLPGFPAGFPPGFPANLQAAAFALAAAANLKRAHPDGARAPVVEAKRPVNSIPQRDGPGDDEDEEEAEEQAGGTQQEPEAADDEVLSSDSEPEEEEEGDVQNFLCCQYEKVTRTKNRWKVSVKEGVFHINGKDYLFKKAQGEWIF